MKFLRFLKAFTLASLALVLSTQNAFAVTECTKQIYSIFNGNDLILMVFHGGGSAYVCATNTNYNITTSFALSALLTSRSVVVRYAADGVLCAAYDRTDVVGLWVV